MFRSLLVSCCAAALYASMVSLPVEAEDASSGWPHWGMERMMSGDWGAGGMMGWGRSDGMLDRVDGRLAYMKTELRITGDQAAAWSEFESAVKQSAEAHNQMMLSMRQEFKPGGIFEKPLPERLSWHVSQLEGRLKQLQSLKAAVDKLYKVLTPDQMKAADEVFLPMMGMGMGRGSMSR